MKIEVVCPEDYMGDVIGDLNSRRGWSTAWTSEVLPVSSPVVPLANSVFGYATSLRSKTRVVRATRWSSVSTKRSRRCRQRNRRQSGRLITQHEAFHFRSKE